MGVSRFGAIAFVLAVLSGIWLFCYLLCWPVGRTLKKGESHSFDGYGYGHNRYTREGLKLRIVISATIFIILVFIALISMVY